MTALVSHEKEEEWCCTQILGEKEYYPSFPFIPLHYTFKHNLYRVTDQKFSHLSQTSIMEASKRREKREKKITSPKLFSLGKLKSRC